MTLNRGPCFGTCPVFEIEVRPDGQVTYGDGSSATKAWNRTGRVTNEVVRDFERLWQACDPPTLPAGFGGNQDASTCVLTIARGGKVRTIVDRECGGTPELAQLYYRFERLIDEVAWRKP
jgi:hypothetical protein